MKGANLAFFSFLFPPVFLNNNNKCMHIIECGLLDISYDKY